MILRNVLARGLAVGALLLLLGCGSNPPFETVASLQPGVSSFIVADGDIWIGNQREGLVRLAAGTREPVTLGDEAGLSGKLGQIMSVEELDGDLLLATAGGVVLFSRAESRVKRVWTDKHGLGHSSVRWAGALDGKVWAATIRGASRLLPGRDRWKNYRAGADDHQNHIYRILHYAGTIWASRMTGGLIRFDPTRDRWEQIPQTRGLGNKNIYSMTPAANGLWLGTAGGVNRYLVNEKNWDEVVCLDPFTDYCVYALVVDGDTLWFGTAFGLYRRDLSTGRQETYTATDGLPGNDICALRIVDGILWIATKTGIAKLDLEQ